MATSGTRAFSLDAATAIEEAFEVAGLELRTGYDALAARRSLNLIFADWSNRGIQLWEVTQVSTSLVEGTNSYALNAYDIDILDAVIRRDESGTDTDLQITRIDRMSFLVFLLKLQKADQANFTWSERSRPLCIFGLLLKIPQINLSRIVGLESKMSMPR